MTGPDAPWVALQIHLAAEAADGMASLLADEGVMGVVTEVWDAAGGDAVPPGRALLEAHVPAADADRVEAAVRAYLASLAVLEPAWAESRITRTPVAPVDWEAVFRRHHHPVVAGTRLVVAPPWDVPPAGDRIVLVVEPGMAFGTGQHATTRTCLEEIETLVDAGRVRSALDVGTGSGVLAAALRRLGVARVVGVDCDPDVVPIARETLAINRAADVVLAVATASALRGHFDLVVANLLADVLVVEAQALAARVAPGGSLVVSGLLADQVDRVTAAYPGWRVAAVRADDPWRTLRLEREA